MISTVVTTAFIMLSLTFAGFFLIKLNQSPFAFWLKGYVTSFIIYIFIYIIFVNVPVANFSRVFEALADWFQLLVPIIYLLAASKLVNVRFNTALAIVPFILQIGFSVHIFLTIGQGISYFLHPDYTISAQGMNVINILYGFIGMKLLFVHRNYIYEHYFHSNKLIKIFEVISILTISKGVIGLIYLAYRSVTLYRQDMADYTEQGWLYISLEQLVNICAFIYMIYWIWDIKDLYDLVDNTYSNSIHLSDLLSGDSEESAKPDFIESARQHSATPPSIVQTTAVEEVVINSEELPVENAENKAYLTSQQCEDLSKQLLTVFEAEQLYLNANLTLLDIAKRFKLRTYELSWLLNQYMKVSFTDFVNKYRVEYAKELLMRNMHKTYNIEGIGKLSGFSTKSTFFRVFKQSTGFSPLQYADQKSVKQST